MLGPDPARPRPGQRNRAAAGPGPAPHPAVRPPCRGSSCQHPAAMSRKVTAIIQRTRALRSGGPNPAENSTLARSAIMPTALLAAPGVALQLAGAAATEWGAKLVWREVAAPGDRSYPPYRRTLCDQARAPVPRGEYRLSLRSRGRALLMLFLFSDVSPDDAPTRIRVGSHLDVPMLLEPGGEDGRE